MTTPERIIREQAARNSIEHLARCKDRLKAAFNDFEAARARVSDDEEELAIFDRTEASAINYYGAY